MSYDFHGRPVRSISNQWLRIDVWAEGGPRILRLVPAGSERNLLAEVPDLPDTVAQTPYGTFEFMGGHRLWEAPEAMPRTYMPDSTGLAITETPGGLTLDRPADPHTNLSRSIAVTLASDAPTVKLVHAIQNDGLWPIELAPWAITQMAMGGVAIMPIAATPTGFLPDRQLALWPYARLSDPRLFLHDDMLVIEASARMPPFKVGTLSHLGWLGYLVDTTLFVKQWQALPTEPHPDFNCNAEIFVNNRFLELESIAPLRTLEPGARVEHTETWHVYANVAPDRRPDALRALVRSLSLPLTLEERNA